MKKRLLPGVLLLLTLVLTACSASGASVLPGRGVDSTGRFR